MRSENRTLTPTLSQSTGRGRNLFAFIPATRTAQLRTALLAISAFAACSIAAAARSRGFVESDGATHFIFARHALQQPIFFLDIWGRPLCTALFALPANFGGLLAVRITSMLAAIACALIAMAIAAGQEYRWPALALIFTLGQPLLFLHSFSELTELPFAVVGGLWFLSYQRKRWWLLAIFAAIAPLGRPEGFALCALTALLLPAHRKFLPTLVLPVGLIAWSIAGHLAIGPADRPWWTWLPDHWPYESGSAYPAGSILYFLGVLPMVVGPLALPAMWIGLWQSLTSAWPIARLKQHAARVGLLMAALPLVILIGHSLLHALGKFSSSGAPRYLLIVAPLWGCLAARGWEWAFARFHWQRTISWAALAVVLPGLVNYDWRILPMPPTPSWQQAARITGWYQHAPDHAKYPRIMANHPGVYFYLDASPWDRSRVEPWSPQAIDHPPAGVLLAWDPEFCLRNADPKLVASIDRLKRVGWIEDPHAAWASTVNADDLSAQPSAENWRIFVSQPK